MTRTQNRFRNAADQMPAHVTRPMCAHHDEIRLECLGCLHECVRDARAVRIDYLGNAAHFAVYSATGARIARMIELPVRTGITARVSHTSRHGIANVVRDNARRHQHRVDGPRQLERL